MRQARRADLSVKTTDGVCTLDWSEDGGYIKTGTLYRLHIAASVAGSCQTRVFQYPPGTCVNSTVTTRNIGTSTLSVDGVFKGYVVASSSTLQNYDTTVPTNTTSTGVGYSTAILGAHTYTSSTNATQTSCTLAPPSFPQNHAITVNALKCQPKFVDDTAVDMPHLAPPASPDKVEVFLDPASMADAATALDAAIADWNTSVSGAGVPFDRVSVACGNGPRCITVEATSPEACGRSEWGAPDGSGAHTGFLKLQVLPSWNTWTPESLQRTFAHELGHFLGVGNYSAPTSCVADDAVMHPGFGCGPTVTPLKTVTLNDSLPILNGVYGGKSKRSCGF